MPKVKSEMREKFHGQLFGPESESVSGGIGFKDKNKALETLKILEDKDITYQLKVINTMFHRAEVILKRTQDEEKKRNLTEAKEVFKNWIDDYKSHSRHKENFGYLPLDVVEAYQKLAKHYKIKDNDGFLEAYKEVQGDYKKLRNKTLKNSDITWDVHRNRSLKPLVDSIKDKNECMFETKDKLDGLPSKAHTEIIMWGYSPDVSKIKKCVILVEEKL